MTRRHIGWISAHSALIILGACLSGLPFAEAKKKSEGSPVWYSVPGDAAKWDLVHMEGLANAILMLAAAAIAARLIMSPRFSQVLFWALLATGWGNFLGALAAALGNDGVLVASANYPAFLLFTIAAIGVFVAVVVLVWQGIANARRPDGSIDT